MSKSQLEPRLRPGMARQSRPLLAAFAGGVLSMFVFGMLTMAVPWLLITSGHSVAWAGLASFVIQLPIAVGMTLGGYFGDAFGPRRIVIGGGILAILSLASATMVAGSAHPTLIVVTGLLAMANLAGSAGDMAQESRLPEMARLARWPLARANAVMDIAQYGGMASGGSLSVMLIDDFGLATTLGIATMICVLVTAIDVACFPRFARRIQAEDTEAGPGFFVHWKDRRLALLIVLAVLLVGAFAALDDIVVPALATQAQLPGGYVARFLLVAAIASTLSTSLYAWRGHRWPIYAALLVYLWVTAAGFGLLAALPATTAMLWAPILIGIGAGPLGPLFNTIVQQRAPARHRGAVLGSLGGGIMLVQPVAALASGVLVAWQGSRMVVYLTAGIVLAAAVVYTVTRGLLRTE